jgi:hypothetical protein
VDLDGDPSAGLSPQATSTLNALPGGCSGVASFPSSSEVRTLTLE